MIRYTKGKFKWNRKATYGVDQSLGVVIYSYLVQLKNQLENANSYSVPMYYCEKQAEIQGLPRESAWGCYDGEESLDFDAAHQMRMKDLDELIWTFDPKSVPDISKYDFTFNFGDGNITCSNEEARDQYHRDQQEWWKRKEAANKLFGEVYNTLDW